MIDFKIMISQDRESPSQVSGFAWYHEAVGQPPIWCKDNEKNDKSLEKAQNFDLLP